MQSSYNSISDLSKEVFVNHILGAAKAQHNDYDSPLAYARLTLASKEVPHDVSIYHLEDSVIVVSTGEEFSTLRALLPIFEFAWDWSFARTKTTYTCCEIYGFVGKCGVFYDEIYINEFLESRSPK